MLLAAKIIYITVFLQTTGIALLFFRSQNGMLRKFLVAYFICLAIGLFGRVITLFGTQIHSLFLVLPLFIASTILSVYFLKKY